MNRVYGPNKKFWFSKEIQGEFRMGAIKVVFELPFFIENMQKFLTAGGEAVFLDDHRIILFETRFALLFDLESKKSFHLEAQNWGADYAFYRISIVQDEVKFLTGTQARADIKKIKLDSLASVFKPGYGSGFDGIFPYAKAAGISF